MRALLVTILMLFMAPLAAATGPAPEQVEQAVAAAGQAIEAADFAAWAAHFDEDSDITMDMDPLPERGQRQLDYETFMRVGNIGIQGLENPEVIQTIESLQRDADTGDILLVLVTTVRSDLLGMRMEEVTRSETRYGLKQGQLHVRSYREEVLRSGPMAP